tara:strand:+ start:607 stop:804 length:198 start_codon:yes stop_codon:yes gene_type:complete
MSKKHIVVLTDKQINLLHSSILTEYALGLDDSDSFGYKGRMHPEDARNFKMVENIQKALANSMEV